MGLGVVLIFYAIAMTIAATVVAIVFGAVSYFLTRQSWPKSKRAVIASVIFPYVCVGFAGAWFISYAVITMKLSTAIPVWVTLGKPLFQTVTPS